MKEKLKYYLYELLKTFSSNSSFFSSKRIERSIFTITSVLLVIGTFVYLWLHKQITETGTVILITPLLLAAGFNLTKTESNKKTDNTDTITNG